MSAPERPRAVDLLAERPVCLCGLSTFPDSDVAARAAAAMNTRRRDKRRVAAMRCAFGSHHVADTGRVRRHKVRSHFARNPHHNRYGDHRS